MKVSRLGAFDRYLRAQAALPENTREGQPLAITISREASAGGITIAELLAQRLTAAERTPDTSPWAVFDANLAKQVLEDHKLPRHAAASYHMSEAEGVKLVKERDQARRRYVRRYLNAEIDDPTLYDVTLNTGRFGFARSAEAIGQLALQHYHAFAERERAELDSLKSKSVCK